MLERIRENSQGMIVKVILGFIILSFALTGISSFLVTNQSNEIAQVNGQVITKNVFERNYKMQLEQQKANYGKLFDYLASNNNYLQTLQEQTLTSLINQELLNQQSEQYSQRVSDSSVRKYILSLPDFQNEGKFNTEKYISLLKRSGLNTNTFESMLRKDLEREQIVMAVADSNFNLTEEQHYRQKLIHQKRKALYQEIDTSDFTSQVQIKDQEILDYYESHKRDFQTEEQLSIEYIDLKISALKENIQINEKDAFAYYESHKSDFTEPEKRSIKHIMLNKKSSLDINKIYEELEKTSDFNGLAKKYSQISSSFDSDAFFTNGEIPNPLNDTLFSLEKGELSNIIETENEYHIIKLVDIRVGNEIDFKVVNNSIIERLKEKEATDLFYQLKKQLVDVTYEYSGELNTAKTLTGLKVITSPLFKKYQAPSNLDNEKITQTLFSDEVYIQGLNSEVLEISPDHVMVFRVKEKQPSVLKSRESVQNEIAAILKSKKSEILALDKTQALLQAIKHNERKLDTGFKSIVVSRGNSTYDSAVISKLFAMARPTKQNTSVDFIKTSKGYMVLKLVDVLDSEASQDEPEYRLPASYKIDHLLMLDLLREHATIEKNLSEISA